MTRTRLLSLRPAALALVGSTFILPLALTSPASAATGQVFGVTESNTFITFSRTTPGTLQSGRVITGLADTTERVLAIDIRPTTGVLYAVTNQSRLYTIDPVTAAATRVGELTVRLSGTEVGIDFNPVADSGGLASLRVVTNSGQNLRVDVTNAATTRDADLAYAAGDVNTNKAPSIGDAAYTNNTSGATSTRLLDIDTFFNNLSEQAPPNSGTLTTKGSLGSDPGQQFVGFDIADDGIALASYSPDPEQSSRLYRIDVTNGTATSVGVIAGTSTDRVRDIAQEPTRLAPPVIPEITQAALLPLSALAVAGAAVVLRRRHLAS